jgi:hypothetical protein
MEFRHNNMEESGTYIKAFEIMSKPKSGQKARCGIQNGYENYG